MYLLHRLRREHHACVSVYSHYLATAVVYSHYLATGKCDNTPVYQIYLFLYCRGQYKL
jgi:hypothetical protein